MNSIHKPEIIIIKTRESIKLIKIKPIDIPQNAPKTTSIESIEAVERIKMNRIKLIRIRKNYHLFYYNLLIPPLY